MDEFDIKYPYVTDSQPYIIIMLYIMFRKLYFSWKGMGLLSRPWVFRWYARIFQVRLYLMERPLPLPPVHRMYASSAGHHLP